MARKQSVKNIYALSSQELEKLIRDNTDPQVVEGYFSAAEYTELRQVLQEESRRGSRSRGPRVLLLPGIMGSTLGRLSNNDTIWIDPIFSIPNGELYDLAFDKRGIGALDTIPLHYLLLRKRLQNAGFDVEDFFYDWRLSLDTLGSMLDERLKLDSNEDIMLVAHSMGGLVARAAIHLAGPGSNKISRLVMLGTPHHGSFNVLQVMQGTYSVTRQMAALDFRHDALELTENVFNTLPSVYQLLPSSERFPTPDLYDPSIYPASPRFDAQLLRDARRTQDVLAKPDHRFHMIAGMNQDTITAVSRGGAGFNYHVTRAGDGTVPLASAELFDTNMYYVEASHSGLTQIYEVAAAVADILSRGTTNRLKRTPLVSRRDVGRERIVTHEQLQELMRQADQRRAPVTDSERNAVVRSIFEPLLFGKDQPPVAGSAPRPSTSGGSSMKKKLRGITISKNHRRQLHVCLANGSIANIASRSIALGIFENVTPTGPATALDAALGGTLAEFTSRRMFKPSCGQVFILPMAYTSKLTTDSVLLVGLGAFDQLQGAHLQLAAENMVRAAQHLRIDEIAMVVFGAGSRFEVEEALEHLFRGVLSGLNDLERFHYFQRITLCELDGDRHERIADWLRNAADSDIFDNVDLILDQEDLTDIPVRTAAAALPQSTEAPVYLYARHQEKDDLHSCELTLLTSGGKAVVVPAKLDIPLDELNAVLQLASSDRVDVDRLGKELSELFFKDDMKQAVMKSLERNRHLVIVHNELGSRIPWETIQFDNLVPALAGGMSRRLIASPSSIAKYLEQRRFGKTLSVLLVYNPTGDLPGAEEEGEALFEVLQKIGSAVECKRLVEKEATHAALLSEFQSGKYDLIHYAGHAQFEWNRPEETGILCADGKILSGLDLQQLQHLPAVVIVNACESARVRRRGSRRTNRSEPPLMREMLMKNVAFAEAFLRGGVANYLGTYWPVGDTAAKLFADAFYRAILDYETMGQAVLKGRQQIHGKKENDWANYIHFGDADFRLKAMEGE
jgi:pimeloyl-ACP methyl ester carboxylesterase